jgi:hypothetical protein
VASATASISLKSAETPPSDGAGFFEGSGSVVGGYCRGMYFGSWRGCYDNSITLRLAQPSPGVRKAGKIIS